MTTSNLNSAVIMGFFAASIGLIVICFAALQDNDAAAAGNNDAYASVIAEDIIAP